MPFIDEKPSFLDKMQAIPEAKESTLDSELKDAEPAFFSELLPAAFRRGNTVGSFYSNDAGNLTRFDLDHTINSDFDPFPDLHGYEEYASSFAFANSNEDVQLIKTQIDREQQDYETIEKGGWMGTLAAISAGVVDPINLIPVGGTAVKSGYVGRSLLRGSLATSRSAIIGESVAEFALHSTQETRTFGESAANITGAAFLGAVIGGAAGAFKARLGSKGVSEADFIKGLEKDLTIPKADELDLLGGEKIRVTESDFEPIELSLIELPEKIGEGGSVGAAMTTRAEIKLKSALGIENIGVAPNLRTITSPSQEVRRVSQELIESPLYFEGGRNGVAVETEVKTIKDREKFYVAKVNENAFLKYRKKDGNFALRRVQTADMLGAAKREGVLNWDEFKTEISKAMRRGDESSIPEVAQAAKANRVVIERYKNEAIKVGLLPEDVKVTTAVSYVARIYDRPKIMARRNDFERITASWLKSVQPELEDVHAVDVARQIIDNTLGMPEGRLNYRPIPLSRGPLKQRVWDIPDELIEDYLINDIEAIMNGYVNTMVPDIALAKRFGSVDMSDQIEEITNSFKDMAAKILDSDPAAGLKRKKLLKRGQNDVRDIEASRDILRGNYSINSQSVFNDVLSTAKTLNYARLLGGVTITAIPDLASGIFVHGITRTIQDSLIPFIRNFGEVGKKLAGIKSKSAYAQARRELKDMGIGINMLTNSRVNSLSGVASEFKTGGLEKFNRRLNKASTFLNAIAAWTDMVQTSAGYMGAARILRAATANKLSKKEAGLLNHYGLNQKELAAIKNQFLQFGRKENGAFAAGLDKWTDRQAYDSFNFAIRQLVDAAIITPGLDKPLFFHQSTYGLLGQFKTFIFSAHQRYFLAGLQRRDLESLSGATAMIGLGMMTVGINKLQRGEDLPKDSVKWLIEGIDRSGVTGVITEANNMVEKFTRGNIGLSALTGDGPMSRYASRSFVSALLGPAAGFVEDLAAIGGSTAAAIFDAQPFTSTDLSAARRLLPFQNVFYLRKLYDFAEEGLRKNLGVKPPKKKRRK